ncbi:M36 family metallopeptidase [Piscinibacter sp. XHJ-5]|uniref:M36 family metallopeptidase n=1 Tax=Piscinibacter sp. XHJ-5 TaxID=3037797 RepID=UPI002452BD72|nr:M36 family metallopeptidase [Piscinibacter sp. XHJ-5]
MHSVQGLKATAIAVAVFAFASHAFAQEGSLQFDKQRAQTVRAAAGQALGPASRGAPADAVQAFLRGRGKSESSVAALRQTDSRTSAGGVTHVRMEQQVAGLTVYGAYVKAALNARGELVQVIERTAAISGAPKAASISESQALSAAMQRLHPAAQASFAAGARSGNTLQFAGGAFFHSDPRVTKVAVPMNDGSIAEGYLVETWTRKSNELHHTLVGGDGTVLSVERRTASDSYSVFIEDPLKGPQTTVNGPAPASTPGTTPSPAGWLGSVAQSTFLITGNNVKGYLDTDANNKPDSGGTAVADGNFLTAWNGTVSPTTTSNKAVAVQNLFYLNNVIHDKLYTKGFTEATGNFQADNFGRGGRDGDPVLAEAHDGSGTDNANFATPNDGRSGRMQMYLWTGPGQSHEVRVNSPISASYNAVPAAWGAVLNSTGVTGNVVLANDGAGTSTSDACESLTGNLRGVVVLADRGSCDFVVKAANAQRAGAIGIIVANNQGTIETLVMGGDANIRIPGVMIGKNDGAALRALTSPNVTLRKLPVQPLQLDASLDADVVFHEYGHGLTWRMIGGMSGPLAGAIGEGASDTVAMFMNGDDRIGEYSASNPAGIRRAPYAGYPLKYGDVKGEEVHDDGEIYAAAMWRLMELFGTRREQLFTHFVDGMNYTPSTPAFEDMRDGMLQSIANTTASATDCGLVWQAFAEFGIGQGAQGIATRTGATVTPSTVNPGNTCSTN